jgi:hypothetical protein
LPLKSTPSIILHHQVLAHETCKADRRISG